MKKENERNAAKKQAAKAVFSKQDTLIAKGVAILFLIAYHCFSSVSRLHGCEVSFYPLSQKLAMNICESMNICVGMFAFLSSYGLTKTMKFKNPSLDLTAKESTDFFTKRTVSLLGAFFMPFVIGFVTSVFIVGYDPYGDGLSKYLNILADMLGIAGLLHTPMLIGTWWYMSFALVIIALMPLTAAMYKKIGFLCIVPYAVLPILFFPEFNKSENLNNMTRWLLTIPLGLIFAECGILEKAKQAKLCKNPVLSKIIKFVIFTAVLFLLFVLRVSEWGETKFFYYISSILPVVFIYYLYEFVNDIPVLNRVLAFFGEHSSNIFFMHTFIRGVWFREFTYSFGHAALIFLFMTAFSIAISYAIIGIQKLVKWNDLIKKLTDAILKQQNKLFASA